MFVGYQASTSVGASSPYVFTQKYLTNNNISYNSSTGVFSMRATGWYEVHFDTTGTATGDITPTLYVNGTASSYAAGAATLTSSTTGNVSFDTVVYVQPVTTSTYATLQVVNAGAAETVDYSNIVIKRIG